MRIGDDQSVGLELADFLLNARELVDRGFAREFQLVQHNRPERQGRTVGPYRVDRIGIDRHQGRPRPRRRLAKSLRAIGGVQPWIVAEACALHEVRLDPFVGECCGCGSTVRPAVAACERHRRRRDELPTFATPVNCILNPIHG